MEKETRDTERDRKKESWEWVWPPLQCKRTQRELDNFPAAVRCVGRMLLAEVVGKTQFGRRKLGHIEGVRSWLPETEAEIQKDVVKEGDGEGEGEGEKDAERKMCPQKPQHPTSKLNFLIPKNNNNKLK